MNEAGLTVSKAALLEALARFESSIRIRSIQVIEDEMIMITGKQGDRVVFYVYEDQCWVEK